MLLQLGRTWVHTCSEVLSTRAWQRRLTSRTNHKPIALLRCVSNAHNGKAHVCLIVSDLKLATVSRTEVRSLARILVYRVIRCRTARDWCHRWVILSALIKTTWKDASAAHVSIIRYVSHDGIAAMGLVCSTSSGAVLPAPGLISDLSLEDSHVCLLFARGMAMMNVDVSLSSGSEDCSGTTVAVSLGCGVPASFCTRPSRGLTCCSTSTFSDRRSLPCVVYAHIVTRCSCTLLRNREGP